MATWGRYLRHYSQTDSPQPQKRRGGVYRKTPTPQPVPGTLVVGREWRYGKA
jgi:hypothetical protein